MTQTVMHDFPTQAFTDNHVWLQNSVIFNDIMSKAFYLIIYKHGLNLPGSFAHVYNVKDRTLLHQKNR